jgi:hypothetical protein
MVHPLFVCFRNCLLTEGLVVKLSDVAMGMAEFSRDYSDVGGRRHAPIRWQPWETILAVSSQHAHWFSISQFSVKNAILPLPNRIA